MFGDVETGLLDYKSWLNERINHITWQPIDCIEQILDDNNLKMINHNVIRRPRQISDIATTEAL